MSVHTVHCYKYIIPAVQLSNFLIALHFVCYMLATLEIVAIFHYVVDLNCVTNNYV